jgi:hypothetical protein
VFSLLPPDDYTLSATDTGTPGCRRTVKFTVAELGPIGTPLGPPAGAPVGIDFSLHPRWYTTSAAAGTLVLCELWAEQTHYGDEWRRVVAVRLRANAAGQVEFRVDKLLHELLAAFEPKPSLTATQLTERVALNYFVRTVTLAADTGRANAAYVPGPLRTVLRGGLPAELRSSLNYFDYRIDAYGQPPFLTWRPHGGQGSTLTRQQPEWLTFLSPGNLDEVRVKRRYYAPDGTPTLFTEVVAVNGGRGSLYRVLAIPVKPGTC